MRTLTIKPFPESSYVVITDNTSIVEGTGQQSITVEDNQIVTYTVSSEQFKTETGTKLVAANETINITLESIGAAIPDTIVPSTGLDVFPTHIANLGKGGWHQVKDLTERDLILSRRRSAGMAVYVTDEHKLYILRDDLETWDEFTTDTIKDVQVNNVSVVDEAGIAKVDLTDLQKQIDELKSIGKFLSLWDSVSGLSINSPLEDGYEYKTGDYYIVGAVDSTGQYEEYSSTKIYNIGDKVTHEDLYYICNTDETTGEWDSTKWDSHIITNYKPDGTVYYKDVPSTVIEVEAINVNDMYLFDGTIWNLLKYSQKTVTFASLVGDPEDNIALKETLDKKQDILEPGDNIEIIDNVISAIDTKPGTGDLTVYDRVARDHLQPGEQLYPLFKFNANASEDLEADIEISAEARKVYYNYKDELVLTDIKNTKDALDFIIDKLIYENIKVVDFTSNEGAGDFEKGITKTVTSISFRLNKPFREVKEILLNGRILTGWKGVDPAFKTYTYTFDTPEIFNTDKTYLLEVTDDHNIKTSAELKFIFYTNKYYGVSKESSLSDEQIMNLTTARASIELEETEFDFGTVDGGYFYYILPSDIITRDPEFSAGGKGSEAIQQENYFIIQNQTFRNAQGANIPLTIYKFKKTPEGNEEKIFGKTYFKVV